MSSPSSGKSFIPQVDGRALDAIKIVIAVIMVTHHAFLVWTGHIPFPVELAGRCVYPLFAYAMTVSLLRKPSKEKLRRYAAMLAFLALVSEPCVRIARPWDGQLNILFTLLPAILFTGFLPKLKDWMLWLVFAAAAVVTLMVPVPFEYGISGMLLPTAFLLIMQGRVNLVVPLMALLFTINTVGAGPTTSEGPGVLSAEGMPYALILFFCASVVPWGMLKAAEQMPQTGRYMHKYFLHVFYPGHHLVLWAVKMLFLK